MGSGLVRFLRQGLGFRALNEAAIPTHEHCHRQYSDQLVTLAGPPRPRTGAELRELGILENAGMLIEDGRIVAVGRSDEIESKAPPHAVVDAEGQCVTPGFVDAHTHLVFAGNRADEFEKRIAGATYQEIAAAGGGILRTVRLTREASEDELLAAARRHRDWMLRGGTTTI